MQVSEAIDWENKYPLVNIIELWIKRDLGGVEKVEMAGLPREKKYAYGN